MIGKPSSYGAMKKVVQYAGWPGLSVTLKAILNAIATYAGKEGFNAQVSNEMIQRATGLGERWVRKGLRKLEFDLLLITCTGNRKGGRDKAPVWKFELSHDAYPNHSPNGHEWFSDSPRPDKGGTTPTDKGGKGGTSYASLADTERGHPTPEKGAPDAAKGGTSRPKGGTESATQSFSSSNNKPTYQPTPEGGFVGWLVFEFGKEVGQPLKIIPKHQAQIQELAKEHGEEAVRAAWKQFLIDRPFNSDTKHPAYSFIEKFPTYRGVLVGNRERADEEKEREQRHAAAIEADNKRHREIFGGLLTAKETKKPGGPEDYLADWEKEKKP